MTRPTTLLGSDRQPLGPLTPEKLEAVRRMKAAHAEGRQWAAADVALLSDVELRDSGLVTQPGHHSLPGGRYVFLGLPRET